MKILVSGGAGFIGSHIVDALISKKHRVAVVDNLSTGLINNVNPKAKFYRLDIANRKIKEIFSQIKPEIVIHKAAQMNVRKSVADPLFDAKTNILGTINILENCKKYKVKKVVYASSGGVVYGDTQVIPTPESYPLKPTCPLGITKLVGEYYLSFYHQVWGVPFVALRYSNVYGPRQNPFGEGGVVAIFIQKLISGEKPTINGDGEQTRDFVYVDDVVTANVLAMEKDVVGIFNIGTGKETSVNEIWRLVKEITKSSLAPLHGPPKAGEQRRSALDFRKAERILSWKPKIKLKEGILKTIDFFQKETNGSRN